jgi:hypothetical protein
VIIDIDQQQGGTGFSAGPEQHDRHRGKVVGYGDEDTDALNSLCTYDFARRNNFGFNLTYIENDVPSPSSSGFETGYMRTLYQYGYNKARAGDFWAKAPPSNDLLLNGAGYRRSATRQ